MSIDWSKPIETVPCRRNPKPVPCEVVTEGGCVAGVMLLSPWQDSDGEFVQPDDFAWSVDPETGEFDTLKGAVRNRTPSDTIQFTGHPIDQFRHMVVDMAYRCTGAVQMGPGVFEMQDADGKFIGSVTFAEMA